MFWVVEWDLQWQFFFGERRDSQKSLPNKLMLHFAFLLPIPALDLESLLLIVVPN